MNRIIPYIFLFVLLCCPVQQASTETIEDKTSLPLSTSADISAGIYSKITSNTSITAAELKQFKRHLQTLQDLLAQKLGAADDVTLQRFSKIRQELTKLIQAPDTALQPDDNLYHQLQFFKGKIASTPFLAMVNEEARRHTDYPPLTTIRPDKGHGASYRLNETVQFAITASADCFIQVFFLSMPDKNNTDPVLQQLTFFPRPGTTSVSLNAGDTLFLGEDGSFVIEPPYGIDLIIVAAAPYKLKTAVPVVRYPVKQPINFDTLFENIYGEEAAARISLHSCFIRSTPPAVSQKGRGRGSAMLTEEEAETLRLNNQEWNSPPRQYRSIQAGPIVKVEIPTVKNDDNPTIETETPLDLKITFVQKDAPVDMESLEVVARKGFLSKSITDRVREYIRGTVLEARSIDFPRGKFRIQVEIADINGIRTTREYRLEVQ